MNVSKSNHVDILFSISCLSKKVALLDYFLPRQNTQLFSKQEMEQVLNDMENEMRTTFTDELEVFYRMSGVFIQNVMFDAEKQNSTIRADVNFMENYRALSDMKDFEELVMN